MKLGNMIILYVIITLVLLLFQGIASVEPTSGDIDWLNKSLSENQTSVSIPGGDTYTTEAWWDSLLSPQFFNQGIIKMLIQIAAIILGSFALASLVSKSYPTDTFIFGPWFIITLGIGLYPSYLVSTFIMAEASTFMCVDAATFCFPALIVVIIVGASMFVPYLFACIRHWRTGVE